MCKSACAPGILYLTFVIYTCGLLLIHINIGNNTLEHDNDAPTRDIVLNGLYDIDKNTGFTNKNPFLHKRANTGRKPHVTNLNPNQYHVKVTEKCRHERNYSIKERQLHGDHAKVICACLPSELEGRITPNISVLSSYVWSDLWGLFSDRGAPGGQWTPADCAPLRRVAIIIPYRDREQHLVALLAHIHPILQRQRVAYQIFVVEQRFPYLFNKGSVMNAGFRIVKNSGFHPDCVVFHDVDMLLLNDRNMFLCFDFPTHMGAYVDKFNFTLLHNKMFGGAVAISPEQFEEVNGFSNEFAGWGVEDDDFFRRVYAILRNVFRGPSSIARYSMLKHDHDAANPVNDVSKGVEEKKHLAQIALMTFQKHGLNTVQYNVSSIARLPLYTHIVVDIIEANDTRVNTGTAFTKESFRYCPTGISHETTASRVTCEALCLGNTTCAGYQYIVLTATLSTCQFLYNICDDPSTAEYSDLYVRKE